MSCQPLSFSSLVCGAWSVPMMSTVPSLIACQSPSTCAGGEKMPQKSTYFYPKLPSGLIVNKIEPEEQIEVVAAQ